MNSQDLPTKDGPLTVNEQVPVTSVCVCSSSWGPRGLLLSPSVRSRAWFLQQWIFPKAPTDLSFFVTSKYLLPDAAHAKGSTLQPVHKCSSNSCHFWFLWLYFFLFTSSFGCCLSLFCVLTCAWLLLFSLAILCLSAEVIFQPFKPCTLAQTSRYASSALLVLSARWPPVLVGLLGVSWVCPQPACQRLINVEVSALIKRWQSMTLLFQRIKAKSTVIQQC